MAEKERVYKIVFLNQGKVYEIYARGINHGNLFGFVEVEGLLFGETSSLVVDPNEESLRREFTDVERTYIPLHAIVRIDEVKKRGSAKIHPFSDSSKVASMPTTIYTPTKRDP